MKKIISIVLVLTLCSILTACDRDQIVIDGIKYDTYGVLNESSKHNPNIAYEPIWVNIIMGVVLCETIIAPVYFFGFDLFRPIGKLTDIGIKGQVIE